ncbi:ATP-binding protein [Mucilaginibacter agri]|uniref:histidine kinase n=1 Tax=Mucilaginibacter agri TaxID=2695265 RepID=A0A966DSN9_9SPHI|nr:ATP-binding protein [Mucilaginibacter agri]NCD68452.1 tetratricopeptide repeat protein [Mucilaginibacter agri]
MRYFFTSFLLLIIFTGNAATRNSAVDSLLKLLGPKDRLKADTLTINRLNLLSENYFQSTPDSAYYYAQKSISLSRSIKYDKGLANGLLQSAHVDYFKGRTTEAKQQLDEAIAIFKKLNDIKGQIACYQAYGGMYTLIADYELALKYLNLAVNLNKDNGNELLQTNLYKGLGNVYFSRGELSKALDYYYKGLFIAIKNHYALLSGNLYNNIGAVLQNMEVYPNALVHFKKALNLLQGTDNIQALGTINQNIGEILLAQNDYDGAIRYLNTANKIVNTQNDKDGLSSVYTDLGLAYAAKNDFARANSYIDTSLQIARKFKIVYNQAYALVGLANLYNQQHEYQKAYGYALEGQQLSVKLGNLAVKASAALQMSKALAGLGKNADAYQYLNQYINLKEQLKSNESIEKSTSYNFELTFALKERQLKQHQHEREMLFQQRSQRQRLVIAIFLIIIVGMLLTIWIYYREKKRQKEINTKLELKNTEVLHQKTDLDEQAKKLNELNHLKDRLIAILAHDLRAPLSTLKGLFYLLRDSSITHQEMLDMLPAVLKQLDYTSDFLDTLLFWVNSQMESFDITLKPFSVSELVLNEIDNYRDEAQKKGIGFVTDVAENLTATADPNSIRIVVRNLITNAIKFSHRDDNIEISAEEKEGKVIVKIKDHGIGMSKEQLNKLFKSRMDSIAGTQNESGTGMGLLFCKDLIEKCNGEIEVESKPGIGTEFTFTIPVKCK